MKRIAMQRVLFAVALLPASVGVAQESGPSISDTRDQLEKWVETRRVISKERQDWALGQEMLKERLALVQREIDSLREKITQTQSSVGEADKKRQELMDENEKLKSASGELAAIIGALEQRVGKMLPSLPDPIRDRVKPLSQRLPADAATTKLSLSERFQNVVGILNEVNKFNRELTLTSEVRSLPDGTSAEVTALYLGVGQGYYVGAGGRVAGVGRPTSEGWTWTPANDIAPRVSDAIAVLKNEKVASFVQMPLESK